MRELGRTCKDRIAPGCKILGCRENDFVRHNSVALQAFPVRHSQISLSYLDSVSNDIR